MHEQPEVERAVELLRRTIVGRPIRHVRTLHPSLARALPPNIIALDAGLPGGALAKVMVLTQDDFATGLSRRASDHFLRGRLVQRVGTLWVRDAAVASAIERLLADARRDVLRWAAPWMPERFTAADLIRSMLENQ